MEFGFIESMCDPGHYLPLARSLEANGWDAFYVPDSICYPEQALPDQYPYNPHGGRDFLDGVPFLEPFSLIPAMAVVTERLQFGTDVLKLPIRHPTLVAKQVNTVAVMTAERFSLGVGLSPWVEDFAVTGTDWDTRAARMDEMIEIIRGLMSGTYFGYKGEHYELQRIKMSPVPSRPVPILIGGHAKPALRRAARLGDGWISAGSDFGSLRQLLEQLRGYLADYGRDLERYEIHVMSPPEGYALEGARQLRDLGVTRAIYSPRNPYVDPDVSLQTKQDFVKQIADDVIARL